MKYIKQYEAGKMITDNSKLPKMCLNIGDYVLYNKHIYKIIRVYEDPNKQDNKVRFSYYIEPYKKTNEPEYTLQWQRKSSLLFLTRNEDELEMIEKSIKYNI